MGLRTIDKSMGEQVSHLSPW